MEGAHGKADYWLPIKPGTETALMLARMNVLISENHMTASTWKSGPRALTSWLLT